VKFANGLLSLKSWVSVTFKTALSLVDSSWMGRRIEDAKYKRPSKAGGSLGKAG